MLGKSTTNARRVLGTKCDVTATFVFEVVHLFGDNIGGIAEAKKDTQLFKHGGNNTLVPRRFHNVGKHGRKGAPASGLRREDVAGPWTCLE